MNRPMNNHPASERWCLLMRVFALVMAFQLFALPQMLTAQAVVAGLEDCGSQPSPINEEEGGFKQACPVREGLRMMDVSAVLTAQFHQYEEAMLDHPLLEVPHQPPRS